MRTPSPKAVKRWVTQAAGFVARATATQVVTVVVTLAVAGAIAFVAGRISASSPPPSIAAQLSALRVRAERDNATVTIRSASLHDAPSFIVITGHGPMLPVGGTTASDDVQIYDLVAGRLRLRFDFMPAPLGAHPWGFRLDSEQDLLSNGEQEVIGGFSQLIDSSGTRAFIPVIIAWDDESQRYVLQALLPDPPLSELPPSDAHPPGRIVGGAQWWMVESAGAILRDPRTRVTIHGYGGADFIVEIANSFRAAESTGLVTVATVVSVRHSPVLELSGWIMNPTLPRVTESPCPVLRPKLRLDLDDLRAKIRRQAGVPQGTC